MSFCENPVGGDTTTVGTTIMGNFDIVDDVPISTACAWTSQAGLSQTSNAWGNVFGDNTLMGCNALFNGREFKDFILESEMLGADNVRRLEP